VRVSAELAGVVVGEVGRSAEVGGRSDVGVSALVRGGRVGSTVVSLGDSVPLGAGRVPERSVVVRVAESLPPPAPQPLNAMKRGLPRWQSPECHRREHHEEAPPCCTQGWICRATSWTCM
jgi:hypothetical protein